MSGAGRDLGAVLHGALVVVDDVPGEFAERVVEAFHYRPNELYSLVLSGGETARLCYERLAAHAEQQIDWWKVDLFWGDEAAAAEGPSNYEMAKAALLERVGAANSIHPIRPDGGLADYQSLLAGVDRFDVVHLGLSAQGHVAGLYPGTKALAAGPAELVCLAEDPTGARPARITLTYPAIAKARLVLVTVQGADKREALAEVAAGRAPASRIVCDELVWLADPAAAGALE
ncbi:MAG: 6-phosphogluconolactonase [Acidimicrobiales bacterium]